MKNSAKFKFNIIDIIITALFVLAIISATYFFSQKQGIFTNYHYNVEYTIEIDSIDQEIAGNISSGDIIFDNQTAARIGTVTNVYHRINQNDTLHLILNVKGNAEKHNGYITIGGVPVNVGYSVNFRTPKISATGKCVELNVK